MGKRGPRPKPTAMLMSPWRVKQRSDAEIETIKSSDLPPPSYLTRENELIAWEFWCPLAVGQGILADGDQQALAMLCSVFADWVEAKDFLAENRHFYTTTNAAGEEVHHRHPMVDVHDKSWTNLLKAISHFGWTPATRPDVERVTKKENSKLEKLIQGYTEPNA